MLPRLHGVHQGEQQQQTATEGTEDDENAMVVITIGAASTTAGRGMRLAAGKREPGHHRQEHGDRAG